MCRFRWISPVLIVGLIGFSISLFVAGCQQDSSSKPQNQPNADKNQSDADVIKAQGVCPIQKKKLGSMGKPYKVTIKGQPVFLCCESCKGEALANPDKTLSTVAELKRKNKK